MGLKGSVTAAVSGTSVTLPRSNLQIVGVAVHTHTVSGYCSIPVDSTRNAIIPFSAPVGVTTLDVPATQILPPGSIRATHFQTAGSTLNFTGTGLTGGTFVFYFGTPLPGSIPLSAYTGIVVSFTTGTSLAFTFPAGPISLTGILLLMGTSTAQTNLQITDTWNTGTGETILIVHSQSAISDVVPLDNISAAQTLTVTQAYAGTHVGTGYLIIYYSL